MKGKISLADFIHGVKQELRAAERPKEEPFYRLTEVQLEVSFALKSTGKAGIDLYVVELGGEAKAEQVHKVTLTLLPLAEAELREDAASAKQRMEVQGIQPAERNPDSQISQTTGGGGGGGMPHLKGVNYAPPTK